MVRVGEEERTWFRSGRVFNVGEEFYFSTREGSNVGPFETKQGAEKGLELFVETIQHEENSFSQASRVAMYGLWTTSMYH